MQALERNVVLSPATYEAPLSGAFEELEITPFTPESVAQDKRKKMTAVMEQTSAAQAGNHARSSIANTLNNIRSRFLIARHIETV